jgi:hypothetical protein
MPKKRGEEEGKEELFFYSSSISLFLCTNVLVFSVVEE